MVHKIYLGFIGLLVINSVQGINHVDCGLWVKNAKIEMRCNCADGEVPYGWVCRPTDAKCPNGYYDIFEDRCKCLQYKIENDTNSGCENLCSDGCKNGVCIGLGMCSCNAGYSMSKAGKCEPVCDSGCEHGVCVAPQKCDCTEGYSLSAWNKCEPICEDGCENGHCLHPNWCSCNSGYLRVGMNKCEPVCPDGCVDNSYCKYPGKCECNSGYKFTDYGGYCEEKSEEEEY